MLAMRKAWSRLYVFQSPSALAGARIVETLAILIVEDEPFLAADLRDMVRQLGAAAIGSAGRLPEALSLLAAMHWDAALLDLHLAHPVKRRLVADLLQKHAVPFALLTGADEEIDPVYVGVPVLKSPFTLRQVESGLRGLLTGWPWNASAQRNGTVIDISTGAAGRHCGALARGRARRPV